MISSKVQTIQLHFDAYLQVSSPIGTQIPHAVGVAYKLKLDALSGKSDEPGVSAVYFGDGAASSADFHSACNFAATLKVPVSDKGHTLA